MSINRQWLLARRPTGVPVAEDFRWNEAPVPEPDDGEVLVRNRMLSCDPTQRGWMAVDTYLPAVKLGEVMRAFAVGEVVASRDPAWPVGTRLQGMIGWQDHALVRREDPHPPLLVPAGASDESALGVLGNNGMTAYFGLLDIGRPKPGETVVVSAAAGATGAIVGQLAKILGCRAVGIAGGEEKCRYLVDELGFDAAIDYKNENIATRLRKTCPDGVDIYFDNVGGRILDIVLLRLARGGRVVLCGAISSYNDPSPAGPRNYLRLLVQRGRMEGFLVLDYLDRAAEALEPLGGWVRDGRVKERVDVVDGLENAPAALARLFTGENRGKQLVRVTPTLPHAAPDR
jgi:NADPH-dependent curcumin reductase CurA